MMEEALLRFSHIGDQILKQLNNEDYTNCRGISETFKSFIDNQKLLSVRIIKRYIMYLDTDEWQTFIKTSRKEEVSEVAQAVKCLSDDEAPIDVTPLQCAAMFGNCKILKKWLETIKYSPSEMDHQYEDEHPLEFAAKYGQLEAYKLIAGKFENKNPQDNEGITPLHHATAMGHYHICQWILNNVKNKHPKDDFFGETPLECAAENGYVSICQLIMKDDVSNGVPNDAYVKAIGAAAQKGHSKVFESIIGEIKKRKLFAYFIESNVLRAALFVAIRSGHSEVFESIICEIKKIKSFAYLIHDYEFEALYSAVVYGHLKICQFIIENWDVDHPIKKDGVEMMYQTASENGHESICEYLKSNAYFREMLSSKRRRKK